MFDEDRHENAHPQRPALNSSRDLDSARPRDRATFVRRSPLLRTPMLVLTPLRLSQVAVHALGAYTSARLRLRCTAPSFAPLDSVPANGWAVVGALSDRQPHRRGESDPEFEPALGESSRGSSAVETEDMATFPHEPQVHPCMLPLVPPPHWSFGHGGGSMCNLTTCAGGDPGIGGAGSRPTGAAPP